MEQFYSVGEVAKLLGVNRRTILRWIAAGTLLAIKPGRDFRISAGELTRISEAKERSPA